MRVIFRQAFASDTEMTGVIITAYIFNFITVMTAVQSAGWAGIQAGNIALERHRAPGRCSCLQHLPATRCKQLRTGIKLVFNCFIELRQKKKVIARLGGRNKGILDWLQNSGRISAICYLKKV